MRNRLAWRLTFALSTVLFSLPAGSQVVVSTVQAGSSPLGIAANTVANKTYVANITCTPGSMPCPGSGTVTVIDGDNSTATVNVGVYPYAIAVNAVTNQIYVVNTCGTDLNCQSYATVTVIDGATNNTTTVNVGAYPYALAVNTTTNKIYVANSCGSDLTCASPGSVSVIDGNSNQVTATVNVGALPEDVEVDPTTNEIYVVNNCGGDVNCGSNGTVSVINGATNTVNNVQVGYYPYYAAINTVTNQIYVSNNCGDDYTCASPGTVTDIDGSTNGTSEIAVGVYPYGIAVNPITNFIYVVNQCGNDINCESAGSITAINGVNGDTNNVGTGFYPFNVAVNATTNQIYVPNSCGGDLSCQSAGTVTAVDGSTNTAVVIAVGDEPQATAINASTNYIYVTNGLDDTVSVAGGNTKLQFVAVSPCRLVDTRQGSPIHAGTAQSFALPQLARQNGCAGLSMAAAYSLNVTAIPDGHLGYLTLWPTSELQPNISLMNSADGRTKANAATAQAGVGGAVSIFVTDTSNVIVDIDGYYAPSSGTTLPFYPLTPCRVVDTRGANGDLGGPFLSGGATRNFPVLESLCLPGNIAPQAYSFNITAVPHPSGQRLGFLTVWPEGEPQPTVSTLNNPTGTTVANAAVVPAGISGGISVFPHDNTDLLIDINGYFASSGAGGLSLYPAPPCRVLDTRQSNGAFNGELTVAVENGSCPQPSAAQAYIFNATVIPQPVLGYLTLWADTQAQPVVSTLNAGDGAITSNMAVVPTLNGSIDAYASALTQLVLDISNYFAP